MKSVYRFVTALAGGAMIISAIDARAQDWPQWRGPNRDGRATGFSAPETWPKQLTRKWKVVVGEGDATPALAGDKLYVFTRQETNEIIRCLEVRTGKEIWQDRYVAPAVTGPDLGHGGPRSSPAIANRKVLTLGVSGIVSCLDATTGKVLWRKEDFPGAWPRFHTAMSPIIVDGLGILHLGQESAGAIVAYDLATGDAKWKWTGEGPSYASPVLLSIGNTKMVITQSARSLVAIDTADGKLLWEIPFEAKGMAYNAVTPIVDGQRVIYSGQGRGTKTVKIEKENDHFAVKVLWTNPDNSVAFNSPILKNGLIYGLSQRGRFFCINAVTGLTEWVEPTGARGEFGSIVDAGPVLFGLTATAQLTVIQPSNKALGQLASYKVSDKQTYAYPVVAGNRIFIKDQDSVTLWMIE